MMMRKDWERRFYLMDADHNISEAKNIEDWAFHWDDSHRQIACSGNQNIYISTVFLGMDHNFDGDGPPILFETMIFGGENDGYQVRYATYDEAMVGHKVAVALAFSHVKGETNV